MFKPTTHAPDLQPNSLVVADDKATGHIMPGDIKTVFLGGLFIFAILAACYVAAAIILPVVLAIVLKLVLWPFMRVFEKFRAPPRIAAFLILLLLFGGLFALGSVLAAPVAKWAQRLPEGVARMQVDLHHLLEPIQTTQNVIQNAEVLTVPPSARPVTVAVLGSRFSDRLLTDTQSLISGAGETVLVLFFLLASGDLFLRRFIEILPRFQNKRQAVLITQQVESDVSAYLAIITLSNLVVGIVTGLALALLGLSDPVLWGTMAFLLNYAPILGPIIGVSIFTMVGVLSQGAVSTAFLPAILYLCIHLIEQVTLTPTLLAKRFTLNPVLVILGVIFWFWMWGVPGAILATPMLAVTKIICDRIHSLVPIGHFMEG